MYHIKGAQASELNAGEKEQNCWRAGISGRMISIFSFDFWFTIQKKIAHFSDISWLHESNLKVRA